MAQLVFIVSRHPSKLHEYLPQEFAGNDEVAMLGDPPEIAVRRHPAPVAPIEAREIDRARIGAQGPLAPQIDVALEIAHHQLPDAAVDRLAEAETRKVRLGDGAPVAAHPIDADD